LLFRRLGFAHSGCVLERVHLRGFGCGGMEVLVSLEEVL
jgi:hypothetical protein